MVNSYARFSLLFGSISNWAIIWKQIDYSNGSNNPNPLFLGPVNFFFILFFVFRVNFKNAIRQISRESMETYISTRLKWFRRTKLQFGVTISILLEAISAAIMRIKDAGSHGSQPLPTRVSLMIGCRTSFLLLHDIN